MIALSQVFYAVEKMKNGSVKKYTREIGRRNSSRAGSKGCFGQSKDKRPKFNCYGF
jgi:hypothetical protein